MFWSARKAQISRVYCSNADLRADRRDRRCVTLDLHDTLQVISQRMQAELGTHVFERAHREVR